MRLGYEVRVFESSPEAGGMLRWGIPEYRLPKTIVDGEIGRLQKMGVKIETQVSLDKEFLEKGRQEYDAIFLALGSQKSRAMKIPGEDLPGIESGLRFLKEVRSGKKPFLGREVAVIGGGNTAIDVARTILRLGFRPILIYRRTYEEMPAISDEIEEALKEGVQMEFLTTLVSITPSEGQRLHLEGIKNRLAEPGSDGRRIPVPIEGSHWMIEVDYLISAIGETILSDDLLHPLAWTEIGIKVDEWGRTNLPGVFAAGDATPGPRTVSHAIASGKKAALVMDTFLRKESFDRISPLLLGNRGSLSFEQWFNPPPITHRNDEVVRCEELNVFYFERQAREEIPQLPKDGVRCSSFDEVNLGFSEKSAVQEAGRCFRCGMCNFCGNCYTFCPDSAVWKMEERKAFEFNYEFCKGCGICANECSSHFIDIVPEEK
jgi:NADPH-dependent glutamate synthase beta subunit-like oxidoreductase